MFICKLIRNLVPLILLVTELVSWFPFIQTCVAHSLFVIIEQPHEISRKEITHVFLFAVTNSTHRNVYNVIYSKCTLHSR